MFDATCVKKIARRCEFDALVSFVENGPDRLGKLTFGDAKVRLQDGGDEVSMDTFANEVWEGGA